MTRNPSRESNCDSEVWGSGYSRRQSGVLPVQLSLTGIRSERGQVEVFLTSIPIMKSCFTPVQHRKSQAQRLGR
ncbi:hypothetical protein AOLI_G00223980 [Acnodon oligacanthus]